MTARTPKSSTSIQFYFQRSWEMLALGLGVALGSLEFAIVSRRPECVAIGGSVLTVSGIPLTFLRLLRLGPAGIDDPAPPTTVPPEPGARAVQFNVDYMLWGVQRIIENFEVITGVLFLVVGTSLAGIAAPILALLWPSS